MLVDLLQTLATPAPLDHRRLGCVADSIRTGSRARRCQRAWAPHVAATRAAVRASIAACARREAAVVLGSGRLDDVPLADLAGAFRRVVLVDAVHPFAARWRTRPFDTIDRITADLSGSFPLLLGRADDLGPALPPVCAAPGTDLVVSANLLSQLPIRPVERLEASRRGLGRWRPQDGDRFGRTIVTRHLDALAGLAARVCLVTDRDETEEDRQGRIHDRLDLLYGLDLPQPDAAWTWELAPFGEAHRDRRLLHRVAAFHDWRG